MTPSTRRRFLLLAGLVPVAEAGAQLIGHSGGAWSIRGTDPVEIFFGGETVSAYHAGYEEGLPFFDPMNGPSGASFTLADTSDGNGDGDGKAASPWPRGVWFALGRVNGYDFRPAAAEEGHPAQKRGVILHKGMNGVLIKGATLTIRTKSEWLDADEPTRRIGSDTREFTFYHREDGALVLDASLELAADAGDLEIGPGEEGAWSVCVGPGFVPEAGAKGRELRNAEGLIGDAALGSRSAWVACQGLDLKGVPGGIAVLDHPGNPGHPAGWTFSKSGTLSANPFPATPRLLPNGESLVFRYRTVFHAGATEDAAIAKAFETFSAR